ncbi:interleukin-6 receptor subunit beta isoform X2 [Anarrhichthys ocellatus]|uniref:interleukin-6 receptor subunit beta isoform X2 n=1 Tax=Anarrhichthys ocellatus TaxID=433405 RepID=UPI0012EEAB59|nr:interleukin-6 receptor subunit beta-like isoform X2 [Anarrhichthys ocellatus]
MENKSCATHVIGLRYNYPTFVCVADRQQLAHGTDSLTANAKSMFCMKMFFQTTACACCKKTHSFITNLQTSSWRTCSILPIHAVNSSLSPSSAFPPAFSVTTPKADPRPPRLIGCVFQNRANVTCHWEAGDTPTTNFTLEGLLYFDITNKTVKLFACTTSDNSCTVRHGKTVRNVFCITITAHGRNGSISSQRRCQPGRTEVMLPPVILNSIKSVGRSPQCLNVTWSYVSGCFPLSPDEIKSGDLKSQIEFTAQGQFDVQVENVTVKDVSFLVCLFRPDTLYTVRLRHRYKGPESPWSPWSKDLQGRTGEDAPSEAPAFWRQVKQTDKNGLRLTSLLWKPLPHLIANGRVLFFNVTCQTKSAQVLNDHMSCRDLRPTSTSCSLLLPAEPCSCALTASTSAGTSPEARIWLSGASETEPPPPSQFTADRLNDSALDVCWMAPVYRSTSGFVVEWFAVRVKTSSILYWEKLNSSRTALIITEGIKPMERYAVSVKGLHGERGAGQNRTLPIYTCQGVPSAGPKVVVQKISGSRVELTWSPVPVEQLHGFIRFYTIFYTTANQQDRKIVPGQDLRYSLKDLSPGNYNICLVANTDAGAGAAGPIVNVHIEAEEIPMQLYAILSVILTLLALVLMGCLAQNKRLKQKLCPVVPDPSHSSMAHWTPKSPPESMKWPAIAERTEIQYSDVILLGEIEPQNFDPDLDLSSQSNLQTYSSYCYSPLPVSEAQTPQNTRKSEKRCIKSSTSAQTTSKADLSSSSSSSSIYSNVLFSPTLKGPPTPDPSLSYLHSNDWQQSAVNDVKLQLGGDSEPSLQSRNATISDSPLSQTDELKSFRLFLSQHQSPVSSSDFSSIFRSSVLPPHPADVASPQHTFSRSLNNSVPSLQPDTFTRPGDTFTGTFSPFPLSDFVDFSLCPMECDPYISSAI